jgi:PGF-CTERM protein
LADEGMALLTAAGNTFAGIDPAEGDTFTIYIYCWDDDGDEMTLSITPPFGSDASFTGNSSISEFIQLTVPTGFCCHFAFGAEWSDGATGGEFEFDIIIESAEDDGDDENEESDSTSAASFVPGFTGVFTIAAFLGAVLVMMRREQEE